MNEQEKNLMTEGSFRRKIIFFAMPILVGQVFQQLYNMVDSLIVGNFVGDNALAAVTSLGNIIWLLVGFFNGFAVGSSIVLARFIGARDKKGTQNTVSTMLALGLIISVILTVLGTVVAEPLLRLIDTPDEVLPDSLSYFRIYFYGITGMVMYNMLTCIQRAAGDSKHPLQYLIISSILNVILDLLFVAVFRWGVSGAALATAIANIFSAVLALHDLLKVDADYRLNPKDIRLYPERLKEIIRLGLPVGFQSIVIQIANVLIQSFINGYGYAAMAGLGAFNRVEGFAFLPINCFGMALTTFVGQNLGAGNVERTKKGIRFGVWTGVIMAEVIGVLCTLLAPYLVMLFSKDPDVIAYGVSRAVVTGPLYFTLAGTNIMASVLEGCGKTKEPTMIYVTFWCIIRVLILVIVRQFTDWFGILNWIYPITWSMTLLCMIVFYKKTDLNSVVLKSSEESV